MPRPIHIFWQIFTPIALIFATSLISVGQTSREEFQKILREQMLFDSSDISDLERGLTVVKILPVNDKKEVAVNGIIRLKNSSEISLEIFQNSLNQQNNKTVVDNARFSEPPVLADFQSFEPEDKDIEAMKKCVVGDCNLKLSAAMIKRLQSEIDWNAPDHKSRTAQLYRQMLLEYVRDYMARGNEALIRYDSRKEVISLKDEDRLLFDNSPVVNRLAPEFADYLKNYPGSLPGVKNEFYWAKVKFGLKPIITITHTAVCANQPNNIAQYSIATKQIYASRYIDSSLALMFLVNVVSGNERETYILFTNRSRSDDLDGMLSGLKRRVVGSEAQERLKEVLQKAKLRIENGSRNPAEETAESGGTGILLRTWSLGQNRVVQFFILLTLAAVLIVLYRRWKQNSKRIAEPGK